MGRWIRRSLWCIALGFVTAWLVAWGMTVALWAGWLQPAPAWIARGIGVSQPWLLELQVHRRPGFEGESWSGDRLDRAYPGSDLNQRNADRVLEIGGAAFAEEREREALAFAPQLEEITGESPGSLTNLYTDMMAMLPPIQRIDDQVSSFPPSSLESRMAATQADSFYFGTMRAGWPVVMLEGMLGFEATFAGSAYQPTEFESGLITIDALKRRPPHFGPPTALSLPFGVIAPAAIANTLFYAISWFALFTGFELARSLRRRMAGRCVRCGYDLRRVIGKTCPECGRTK